MIGQKRYKWGWIIVLWMLTSCAMVQKERVYDEFIIVTAQPNDSFSSLAEKYLNDPTAAWIIAEFNDSQTITPGEDYVIPKKPFGLGGLKPDTVQTVPILLYHRFSKTKSDKMIVLESSFEAQMQYLKNNGYQVISMARFLDFLDFKSPIPPKSVVLAFDDGWQSFYEIAFPILKKFQYPATLFIYADLIGTKNALTWDNIREMMQFGLDIQCHSKTHRNLTQMKKKESFKEYFEEIEKEILYTERMIKDNLNVTCSCLAYPYGDTNELIMAILKKRGYRAGFTVKRGGNPFYINNFTIQRSAIYGEYTLEDFKKNLSVVMERKLK